MPSSSVPTSPKQTAGLFPLDCFVLKMMMKELINNTFIPADLNPEEKYSANLMENTLDEREILYSTPVLKNAV